MNRREQTYALCLCAVLLSSCQSSSTRPRTEVLLQVDADSEVRAQAQRLTVALASGAPGAQMLTDTDPEVFDLTAPTFRWPASLALVAGPGHEDRVFEATITAETNDGPLSRGRVRSAFLKDQTLLLTTSLFGVCIGKFDCQADETCVDMDGKPTCVSSIVDEKQLPVFHAGSDAGIVAADGGSDAGATSNDAGHPPVGATDSGMPVQPERDAGMHEGMDAGSDAGMHHPPVDAGGAGADAGGCIPTGNEQCFNGVDDDCNGKTDCADPACSAGATCAPASSTVGVLVPNGDTCPAEFPKSSVVLHQGLMDNGCSGCSCQSTPTQCSPHVYYYATTATCSSDAAPYSGGTLINVVPTYTCSSTPLGDSQSMDTPVAWRATMFASPSACTASGSPLPVSPSWTTTMKLCTGDAGGGGCQAGYACVPKVSSGKLCGEKAADAECPASSTQQTWQRGFSDNRSCGSCGCTASGGNCNNVLVQLGHDWGCGTIDSSLHGGEKSCSVSTYSPPGILSGLPTNPTCSASAQVNGTLTATQPLDLCCLP